MWNIYNSVNLFQQHEKKQDVGKKKKPVTSADKVGHVLTVETQVIAVCPLAFSYAGNNTEAIGGTNKKLYR